ncbi:MAG: hypothetical protein HKN17_07845 [Rhodothermales bacterium]|nr:hypothetical protein [Rhodothermales bacterium]
MKSWILPGALVVLAALLVAALLSPDAARSVAAEAKGWVENRRAARLKSEMETSWAQTRRLATEGDADAMYRLGMQMRFWPNEGWTGVPVDSARGMDLVLDAAEAGHVDAALVVWKEHGGGVDELLQISDAALERTDDAESLSWLSDWLRWTAVNECDDRLLDAATRVASAHSTLTDARYVSFVDAFDRRCAND